MDDLEERLVREAQLRETRARFSITVVFIVLGIGFFGGFVLYGLWDDAQKATCEHGGGHVAAVHNDGGLFSRWICEERR